MNPGGGRVLKLGVGVEIEVPESYEELERECVGVIESIVGKYPKAALMWRLLREDPEVNACWDMADYIA
ncbi:MAG: hypothetical protein DRK00_09470, partial [Thermoprotei archaeon]